MHRSVKTIDSPEFINIHAISPLISKCEIKVFYLGQNRNGSYIDKATAQEMAQTLPGTPIVGYFSENKDDFVDHGEQMTIDGDGVHFKCLTKPYGFVPLEAKVWFQKFTDTDEFGNELVREYLVTEGYLWSGQFEECKTIMQGGKPHSMELDDTTLKGHWSEDVNKGVSFFIINDAIISKLCILGDDVEPCFEGSSIIPVNKNSNFTKLNGEDEFSYTLFTMLKQLRELKNNKGGFLMSKDIQENFSDEQDKTSEFSLSENQNTLEEVQTQFEDGGDAGSSESAGEGDASTEPNTDATTDDNAGDPDTNNVTSEETSESDIPSASEDIIDEAMISIPKAAKKEFAKEDEKKEDDEKDKESSNDSEEKEVDKEKNNDDDEDKKKYELLQNEFTVLQEKFNQLETEAAALREFKAQVEDSKKDELINSFYMLSEEDKKDVVENKSKYSLDDIEAKLSVICVRKKVNFNLTNDESAEAPSTEAPVTYNLDSHEVDSLPAWLSAVKKNRNRD